MNILRTKYPFDEKDGKKYLEDICSMKGWSDKKAILNFFSRRDLYIYCMYITSQIFDKIYETKYSF